MRRAYTAWVVMSVLLAGCMKDELPVPKTPRGNAATYQFCLGEGYGQQLWFDLGSGTVVSDNARTVWDLAFESAPDGWRVFLNGSRLMTAWDIGAVDLEAAHDTVGMHAGRRIDAPSGRADSTAIGDWRGTGHVYLIDRGYGANGESLDPIKLRMTGVSTTAYSIEYAQLDGSGRIAFTVNKDPLREHTSFSFSTGVLPVEPVIGAWDFCITQYTHQFYEPYLPYLVAGMLTPHSVRVAEIDGMDFAAVALSDTLSSPFTGERNAIGYDWKVYSFETSSYSIVPRRSYIVQDAEGFFFKLRGIEFYGPQGQTGCPQFEVVPL
ncbi:MAG: hypothetical protein IPP83_12970 [Flavobacteriales bacterium]|nr:hypothetical protein [Flavobacteriales bacterium]